MAEAACTQELTACFVTPHISITIKAVMHVKIVLFKHAEDG